MRGRKTGGRQKGVPNKQTASAREAFALFVDETFDDFKAWVFRVSQDDPKAAADLYLKAAEYHVPKLGRTEITGNDGGPLLVEFPPLPQGKDPD